MVQLSSPIIQNVEVLATTCGQANGSLTITALGTTNPLLYSIDSLTFQENPAFTNLKASTYRIYIKDGNGCTVDRNAQVLASSAPRIDQLLSESAACGANTGRLTVVADGQGTLTYSLNGGVFQEQPLFYDLSKGEYEVEVRDGQQCLQRQAVTISEECESEVYVPDAFSPNYDGVNDTWEIKSRVLEDIIINIYNKWGEKIFYSKQGQRQYWDGTYKGDLVSPGVYTYQMEWHAQNGIRNIKKGILVLIR